MREAVAAKGNAKTEHDEGGDDEPVELEVVLGPDAVVEPFAVVIEELDAPSASFAMEAV